MKKAIFLLSSGLDSPVALYLMIKKGFEPICLSFLTSDDHICSMRNKIITIIQRISDYTNKNIRLYMINHDSNLDSFKENCDRKLTCVLCKRLMIRIAREIGTIEGTNIIITGDILGEQASQTLDNLFAYNDILKENMILRPLIGLNKIDVIKINEEIGVYDICSQKSAGCQYNPQFPETHARINEVINTESRILIRDLIERSLNKAELFDF